MSIITVSVFVGLSFHHHPCGHLQYVLHLKAFPGWQEGGKGVVMGFDVLNTVSIPDITVSSTMSSISPPLPIGQTWSSGRGRTYSTFFFFFLHGEASKWIAVWKSQHPGSRMLSTLRCDYPESIDAQLDDSIEPRRQEEENNRAC